MSIKAIFLLLLISAPYSSLAQRIFAVSFCDTDDKKIGKGCAVDYNNFRQYCLRLKATLGMQLVKREFNEDDFNEENFDNFHQTLNTNSNDIILFYISCHGQRSIYDVVKIPQVLVNGISKSVYNKHVSLQSLPHKSLFTIVDACNVRRNISTQEVTLFHKLYTPNFTQPISDVEKRNSKLLYIDKGFNVIVTSSQPGVTSVTTSKNGSIFTNCLLYSLNYFMGISDSKLINIDAVLAKASRETKTETNRMYINHQIVQTKEEQPQIPDWILAKKADSTARVLLDELNKKYTILYKSEKLSLWERVKMRTKNDYRVTLKIDNSKGQVSDIARVTYFFHQTFKRPKVNAIDRARDFEYTLLLWGEFLVKAEILLDDGTLIDTSVYLDLNKNHATFQ